MPLTNQIIRTQTNIRAVVSRAMSKLFETATVWNVFYLICPHLQFFPQTDFYFLMRKAMKILKDCTEITVFCYLRIRNSAQIPCSTPSNSSRHFYYSCSFFVPQPLPNPPNPPTSFKSLQTIKGMWIWVLPEIQM